MNKRRLLKLADLLEADAENKTGIKFAMCDWGSVRNPDAKLSCGTQACAMGLAALSGAFKRAGLDAFVLDNGNLKFKWKGDITNGYDASMALFGLNVDQADILFSPTGKLDEGARGERAKARQIRKFVDTGKIPAIGR